MRKNLAYIFITLILAVLPAWANVDVNALTWIKSLPGVTLNSSNSVKHEYTISSEKNYSQVITGLQQRGWRYTAQRKNPECPNMPLCAFALDPDPG